MALRATLIYPGIAGRGFGSLKQGMDAGWISHGLASLSAAAKAQGFDVDLIDLRALYSWDHFRQILAERDPDVIGVTMMSVDYNPARQAVAIAKELNPEIVTIIGANGAGKSTTLRAISRMVPVDKGTRMTFQDKDLLKYPADKVVSQLGISHVPEGRRLFGNLTVLENLQLATFARKDRENISKDIERVFSILSRLDERKMQKAGTLSGGEQQMLAVGRAFMSGRIIMLLDEPSMGLVPLLMLNVFDALKEINQEGSTILLVEQNARMAPKFAKRGYVLESGNVVLEGDSHTLLENPDVKKAYLGG